MIWFFKVRPLTHRKSESWPTFPVPFITISPFEREKLSLFSACSNASAHKWKISWISRSPTYCRCMAPAGRSTVYYCVSCKMGHLSAGDWWFLDLVSFAVTEAAEKKQRFSRCHSICHQGYVCTVWRPAERERAGVIWRCRHGGGRGWWLVLHFQICNTPWLPTAPTSWSP